MSRLRRESNDLFTNRLRPVLRPAGGRDHSRDVRARAEAEEGCTRSIRANRCARTVRVRDRADRWLEVNSTERNCRAGGRAATRADDRCPLPQRQPQRRGGAPAAAARFYQRLQSRRRHRCVVERDRPKRAEILTPVTLTPWLQPGGLPTGTNEPF